MKRNFAKTPADTIQSKEDKEWYERLVASNNNITVYEYLFDTFQNQNGYDEFGPVYYVIFKEEYQHISGWLSNIILSKWNQPQQIN